jgi:hypothetical protein
LFLWLSGVKTEPEGYHEKRKKRSLILKKSGKAFPVTEEKSYAVRDAVTET